MSQQDLLPLYRARPQEEAFVPVDPQARHDTSHNVLSRIVIQLYRGMLLHLPTMYFSRVSRVFEDAEVSRPEVEKMVVGLEIDQRFRWPANHEWVIPNVSPALIRFKESWESFVGSVLTEWKTLNVVSALLLTAILTILQIQGAATAPVTRTTSFLSLVCALMSLVYGCVYILRFRTMKDMYMAAKWADEAHHDSSPFWNVWVLLAMPAVWIAWSLIFFCICIIDFLWEQPFTSPDNSAPTVQSSNVLAVSLSKSDRTALPPRIIVTFVFCLGLVYFALVLRTFRRWGGRRVAKFVKENMDTGRAWSPDLAQGVPLPERRSLDSRFSGRNGAKMGGDEKMGMEQNRTEKRARSVDSARV